MNAVVRVDPGELEVSFVRSSGPGGQNVNKTATKAVVRWNVASSPSLRADVRERFLAHWASRVTAAGDVLVTSDRFRDQPRNLEDCLQKLSAMVAAVATPPRRRRPTRPGLAARERRLRAKKARGAIKGTRGRIAPD